MRGGSLEWTLLAGRRLLSETRNTPPSEGLNARLRPEDSPSTGSTSRGATWEARATLGICFPVICSCSDPVLFRCPRLTPRPSQQVGSRCGERGSVLSWDPRHTGAQMRPPGAYFSGGEKDRSLQSSLVPGGLGQGPEAVTEVRRAPRGGGTMSCVMIKTEQTQLGPRSLVRGATRAKERSLKWGTLGADLEPGDCGLWCGA